MLGVYVPCVLIFSSDSATILCVNENRLTYIITIITIILMVQLELSEDGWRGFPLLLALLLACISDWSPFGNGFPFSFLFPFSFESWLPFFYTIYNGCPFLTVSSPFFGGGVHFSEMGCISNTGFPFLQWAFILVIGSLFSFGIPLSQCRGHCGGIR